jgi:hypothetical protein
MHSISNLVGELYITDLRKCVLYLHSNLYPSIKIGLPQDFDWLVGAAGCVMVTSPGQLHTQSAYRLEIINELHNNPFFNGENRISIANKCFIEFKHHVSSSDWVLKFRFIEHLPYQAYLRNILHNWFFGWLDLEDIIIVTRKLLENALDYVVAVCFALLLHISHCYVLNFGCLYFQSHDILSQFHYSKRRISMQDLPYINDCIDLINYSGISKVICNK